MHAYERGSQQGLAFSQDSCERLLLTQRFCPHAWLWAKNDAGTLTSAAAPACIARLRPGNHTEDSRL